MLFDVFLSVNDLHSFCIVGDAPSTDVVASCHLRRTISVYVADSRNVAVIRWIGIVGDGTQCANGVVIEVGFAVVVEVDGGSLTIGADGVLPFVEIDVASLPRRHETHGVGCAVGRGAS